MAKKITKWEPEDFELEMTTHWSFPKRGDWATHDAKWRGNWSPYISKHSAPLFTRERFSSRSVLGWWYHPCRRKLLNRNIIGVDVNDVALTRCKEKQHLNTKVLTVKCIFIKVMQEILISCRITALI